MSASPLSRFRMTAHFGQAQSTNDLDEALYAHGVFERDPAVPPPVVDDPY